MKRVLKPKYSASSWGGHPVAGTDPMKRVLKRLRVKPARFKQVNVAGTDPMKRVLKRLMEKDVVLPVGLVAGTDPMKRVLKPAYTHVTTPGVPELQEPTR